jgi:hypothetical protein
MRTIILAATAVLALAGSASAQMITSPGQFCLRTTGGTNQGMETCAYQTMAQCNAAKSGSDTCVPNPSMKGAATATTGSSGKSTTGSAPKSSAGSASKSTTGAAPRQ